MTVVKVPANLPQLVKAAFIKARANGDLLYFQTQVTVLKPSSHPVRPPRRLLATRVQRPLTRAPPSSNSATRPL